MEPKKGSFEFAKKWIDETYSKVSTKAKFLKLIKSLDEEYNEQTKTGWRQNGDFFEYVKEGISVDSPSLGIESVLFNTDGRFDQTVSNSKELEFRMTKCNFLKTSYFIIRTTHLEGFSSNFRFHGYEPKLKLERKDQKDSTLIHNFFRDKIKESKKAPKTETEMKEEKPITETVKFGHEWIEKYYNIISSKEAFQTFIKEKGEEYNPNTRTGWQNIGLGCFVYSENGASSTANSLGIYKTVWNEKIPDFFELLSNEDKDKSIKPRCIEYNKYLNGFTIQSFDSAVGNISYQFYNFETKELSEKFSDRREYYDFIRKQKELKTKTEPKSYTLSIESFKELYPNLSKLNMFEAFIKERGEEYDEKTNTGWLHDPRINRFTYRINGIEAISKLGFSQIEFNGNNFAFLDIGNRFIANETLQPRWITSKFIDSGLKTDDNFLFSKQKKSMSDSIFQVFDIKTATILAESKDRFKIFQNLPKESKEKEEMKEKAPENKKDKKVYELGPELIKEIFPQIDTFDKFKAFIKEIGEEYDEKTNTGWLFSGGYASFRKEGKISISSLGFSSVAFNSSNILRYVEIQDMAFEAHYADKKDYQIRWIETKANLTELKDESRYLIAKEKPGNRSGVIEFQIYDKTRDICFGKGKDKFTLLNKINRIKNIKENKDIELLNIKTLEKFKEFISTKETFEEFLNLSGLSYSDETKTGWMENSLDRFVYFDKGKAVISCFGFDVIEFDNAKKLEKLAISGEAFSSLEKRIFEKHQESYIANLEINPTDENELFVQFRKYDRGIIKHQIYNKKTQQKFEGSSKTKAEENKIKAQKEYDLNKTWIEEVYPQLDTIDKFKALIKERGEEYNNETGFGWFFNKNSTHEYANFYKNRQRDNSTLGIAEISFELSEEGLFRWADNAKSTAILAETYDQDLKIDPAQKFLNITIGNSNSVYDLTGKLIFKSSSPQKLKEVLEKYRTAFQRKEAVVLDQKWIDDVQSKIDTLEKFREYIKEYPPINGEWRERIEYRESHFTFFESKNNTKPSNDRILGIAYISFDENGKLEFVQKVTNSFSEDEIKKGEVVLGISQPRFEGVKDLEDPSIYKIQTVIPSEKGTSYAKLKNYVVNSLTGKHIHMDGGSTFRTYHKEEYDLNKELRKGKIVESVNDLASLPRDFNGTVYIKNRDFLKVKIEPAPVNAEGCYYDPNAKSLLWYKEGLRHRITGPAIEHENGSKEWYIEGKYHRYDGPAIEYSNGQKEWLKNGLLHREGGPAIEHEDGSKEWWVNGELHRENGPAIEHEDGSKEWFKEGKRHRIDGPAIEYPNGAKEWFKEGKRHREDGPAIEYENGSKGWYIEGKSLTQKEIEDIQFKLVAPKLAKVKSIAESDAREVAKRIAANQIARFVQMVLVNSIKSNNSSRTLNKLLDTTEGRAMIKMAIGGAIPILKQHMLPKYDEVLDELSEEFRIQGETDIATSIVDKVISSISSIKLLNSITNEPEQVRVFVEKPLTLINSDFDEVEITENNFSAAKN